MGYLKLSHIITVLILCASTAAHAATARTSAGVAVTIAAEGAGEGARGMYLIACTIANRSRLYHKTPYQIVSQPHQYYGFTAPQRHKRYAEVKQIADRLAAELLNIKDLTNGALYFRRPDEPRFRWCKIETARFQNHIFYK